MTDPAPVPPEWLRSLLRTHGSEPPTIRETLDVSRSNGPRDVVMAVVARTRQLESTTRDRIVFVEWALAATPGLLVQLRSPRVTADLLNQVRGAARRDAPTLWATSITPVPSERTIADWSERLVPLGDFVRELSSGPESRGWTSHEATALAERLDAKSGEIEDLLAEDDAPVSPWSPGVLDLVLATLEPEREESR